MRTFLKLLACVIIYIAGAAIAFGVCLFPFALHNLTQITYSLVLIPLTSVMSVCVIFFAIFSISWILEEY